MQKLEISVAPGRRLPSPARIETAFAKAELRVTLRGTLAKYPSCMHWHLKRGREAGTLEVTSWPRGRRVWISIQDGRKGEWTSAAAKELKALLER